MAKSRRLNDIFPSLDNPPYGDGVCYTAIPVPGCQTHRIARDAEGNPCILLSVAEGDPAIKPVHIRLEHLLVQGVVRCKLFRRDCEPEYGDFVVITCINADPILQQHFFQVLEPIVQDLGAKPSRALISQVIMRLAELFMAMAEAPSVSVQGLWAELFIIARSSEPQVLVGAWHSDPREHYDFSLQNERLEVKSASNRCRKHHFGYEQLLPVTNVKTIIASVFVEKTGGGTSLGSLIGLIHSLAENRPELVTKVDFVVGKSLGQSWRTAMTEGFDLQLAEESVEFFDAQDIPGATMSLPTGVTEVHFTSDISGVSPLAIPQSNGLIRAAMLKGEGNKK